MKITRLLRIGMNVRDLQAARSFYVEALGFHPEGPEHPATLFPGRTQRLRRAHQHIELTQPDTPGAPYPEDTRTNDTWFTHCALATDDIGSLHAHLATFAVTPFTRSTPVTLPGGITAWKFRDPDGHPLELIQFPGGGEKPTRHGIDHAALAVTDPARSIAFYNDLGLALSARQLNRGTAQSTLDDLPGAEVEVVALTPSHPAPHLELLAYHPAGRPTPAPHAPTDLPATRRIFEATVARPEPLLDPDNHHLLLEPDRPVAA